MNETISLCFQSWAEKLHHEISWHPVRIWACELTLLSYYLTTWPHHALSRKTRGAKIINGRENSWHVSYAVSNKKQTTQRIYGRICLNSYWFQIIIIIKIILSDTLDYMKTNHLAAKQTDKWSFWRGVRKNKIYFGLPMNWQGTSVMPQFCVFGMLCTRTYTKWESNSSPV